MQTSTEVISPVDPADLLAGFAPPLLSDGALTQEIAADQDWQSRPEPSVSLSVRCISTESELASLASSWDRLAGEVPFRRWDWLEPWWRHYSQPDWQLFVLAVENAAGQLVGLAPWHISHSPSEGRVVRFLGTGEVCSEYLTVLSRAGSEKATAAALADWLSTDVSEDWDLIELTAVDAEDLPVKELVDQFVGRGNTIHQRPGMDCWRVELPATWDAYLDQISKSRKTKVRKSFRDFFGDPPTAHTHQLVHSADLQRRFAAFVDLHQRRRESLGQSGCFASPQFAAFHEEVSRRFLAQGKLRLVWTTFEERTIAAEYDLVGGQTVYYYQTGIDPDRISVGPGWLGMIGSLKLAIEQGYRSFDFLRGDEAYKSSWGATPRAMTETRIVARRPAARLRHAAWLARENVRRWAKRGLRWGCGLASS